MVWSALGIGAWTSLHAPSPILDQLRNDIALLLADDLDVTFPQPPMPNPPAGARASNDAADTQPVEFADYLLGMWAFAVEVVKCIETLAAPTLPPAVSGHPTVSEPVSATPLLR
jgi:hypothetical protein